MTDMTPDYDNEIAAAQTELAAAKARRDELASRRAEAAATLEAVKAEREALIQEAARGRVVRLHERKKIEDEIQAAESEVAFLDEALRQPDTAILKANGKIIAAQERKAWRKFINLHAERKELLEEAEELGRSLADMERRLMANADDILAACNAVQLNAGQEFWLDLKDTRHLAAVIPASIQKPLLRGYHIQYSPKARNANTWGRIVANAITRAGGSQ